MAGCVDAIAELLHIKLLPMARAEYGGGILSDGSMEAWALLKRDKTYAFKNDKIPFEADWELF